jgi:hypothetical protein
VVKIIIFVEGGAVGFPNLNKKCRLGFSEFFKKLAIETKLEIVACGSRQNAHKDFRNKMKKIKSDEFCILLVDSEAPVNSVTVWEHVSSRQGDTHWQKPDNATHNNLHFMVECMEAWFMADKQTLMSYYGEGLNEREKQAFFNALPKNTDIEAIPKQDLESALKNATRDTSKGKYNKGSHSFDILGKIDANMVVAQSPYASRLYKSLQELQNSK